MLNGQAAIVTGASGGLGRAVALECSRLGVNVGAGHLTGRIDFDTQGPGSITPLRFDVSDESAISAAFDSFIAQTGRLDALLCCAGINRPGLLVRAQLDDVRAQIEVNLLGVLRCAKAAIRHMLRRKSGVVVMVSSMATTRPNSGQSVYACTKGALESLTRALAVEYSGKGIRVYCIRAGPFDTPMWAAVPAAEREATARRTFAGQPGEPARFAELVTYLMTEHAGLASGAVIDFDGGTLRT